MIRRSILPVALLCSAAAALLACDDQKQDAAPVASAKTPASTAPMTSAASVKALPPMPKAAPLPATPAALPELKIPEDNAITPEKVALGKQLFFDKRLSKDGSEACETCHLPDKGWTDAKALSTKVGGAVNTRHTPTMWNVGYNDAFYWDGRAPTLEKNVEAAWKGQLGAEPAEIVKAIAKIPGYEVQFKTVFGAEASPDSVVKALASFVRTLRSGGSPWDKYEAGDKAAVSKEAVKGFELFRNKAGCAACHAPPLYTDNGFHNVGIGFDKPEPDLGRGKISKNEKENGAFKTPTLRSIETSGPYFHDGRAATLEEAVDYMLSGGIKDKNPNLDAKMKKVKLSPAERTELLAFVKALKAPDEAFEQPKLPE